MSRLFASLVLLFVFYFVASSAQQNVFNQESADFNLTCSINPFGYLAFRYYLTHNTTSVYTVTLADIWEADNSNLTLTHAGSNYSLIGDWETQAVKGPTTNDTQYWSVSRKADTSSPYTGLTLNISVPLKTTGSNATDFPAADIEIKLSGYKWLNENSTTELVFTWKLTYEQGTPVSDTAVPLKTKASKTVDFANAYFSALTTTATAGNDTTDVALYLASAYNGQSDSQDVYIVYDHFEGDLDHTVELGFGSGPGSSLWWIIIIVVVIIAIVVIILIAVIGFVLVRRRRRSYDSF